VESSRQRIRISPRPSRIRRARGRKDVRNVNPERIRDVGQGSESTPGGIANDSGNDRLRLFHLPRQLCLVLFCFIIAATKMLRMIVARMACSLDWGTFPEAINLFARSNAS